MAKKKAAIPKAPSRKGRPKSVNPKGRTPISITIRAAPEWDAWVSDARQELARKTGLITLSRTDIIDLALAALAEKHGLPKPPPRT